MKKAVLPLFLYCLLSAAGANDSASWDFPHKLLKGQYGIYGGSLGDPVAPGRRDAKVMFTLDGSAAREMFDAMGPDAKDICTEGSGDRVRTKDNDNLRCTRTSKGKYFCHFGFDLRTGKSIGGVVC